MTETLEQISQVRVRLRNMQTLNDATTPGPWAVGDRWRASAWVDAAFIAACSPDLLLRVVAHAEDILDRHTPYITSPNWCSGCESGVDLTWDWPCPEVASVLRAWTP